MSQVIRWIPFALVSTIVLPFAFGNDIDSEAYWQPRWEEMAELGRGYVVWESNRNGRWRLWRRNLDGTGKRQLTPDEADRDHYGTHISPDGTRIVYISYPRTRNAYNVLRNNETAQLRMIDADGSNDRQLVASARAYFENRCAVWIDDNELVYIDGEGYTCHLDLVSGTSLRLTASGLQDYGWLLDPTLQWAVEGRVNQIRFSEFNAKAGTIHPGRRHGGCQPYFTQDGVWGFWTSGAGGPIRRIHLASGEVSDILVKNDPRLPRQRSYLYFPMVSPCQRMFAVGASPDQHDHHRSDYAVFVFRLDPETLEVFGNPARYSFDGGTDRYPNVFLAADELGVHRGKAPFPVSLEPEKRADWQWEFGDGTTARGARGRHTYTRPGTYRVSVRHGDERLTGTVVVAEATPPYIRLPVIVDGRAVRLHFNEPVSVDRLRARLESGIRIEGWRLSEDKTQLTLDLATELDERDVCHLEGIADLAQRPNAMPPQRLELEPLAWPSNPDGLVFLWQTGETPNLTPDPEAGEWSASPLTARGKATLNQHYAMFLRGGAFLGNETLNQRLLERLQATDQLTLEATITPVEAGQQGPARILSFSRDTGSRNFTLGQGRHRNAGHDLVLRLRTPQTGRNAHNPEVVLCRLTPNEPNHIIVTYQPGRLVGYRNGEKVFDDAILQGGFDTWEPQHFLIGDEYRGDRGWEGKVEGIAVYDRFMDAEEARLNAEHTLRALETRTRNRQATVIAELVNRSEFPTLDAIAPYLDALVVYEYRVLETLDADDEIANDTLLRVVHWALLTGDTMPARDYRTGNSQTLTLEPFADNPQLHDTVMTDTLEDNFDAVLYYDVLR